MYKRDCFELRAYLDSEVTASEGRQIEDWVTTDPGAQSLYARVLRQQRQRMPMLAVHSPVSTWASVATLEQSSVPTMATAPQPLANPGS